MSLTKKIKDFESSSNKKNISSKIENLLNEIKEKEISELAHMNEENKVLITNGLSILQIDTSLFWKSIQKKLKKSLTCQLQRMRLR